MPVRGVLQQLIQDAQVLDTSELSADFSSLGGTSFRSGIAKRLTPAAHGFDVSFSEVHRDVRKPAHHAWDSTFSLDSSQQGLSTGLQPRQQLWRSFLGLCEPGLQLRRRTAAQSFLVTESQNLPSATKLVDDAAGYPPKAAMADNSADNSAGVPSTTDTAGTLYNPQNGRNFMMALPICAGAACAFELLKGRIAETDLQAPLPELVHNARQETSILSSQSVWRVLAPYIKGATGAKCAGYALAHVFLLAMGLYVDLVLTQWNGVFWSSLQSKSSMKFYQLLWDFGIITVLSIAIGIYNEYIDGMWHLHARDHLTRYFNQIWLRDGAMCKMQQAVDQVDNPDQRIEEDVDEFVGTSRELLFGGLGSVCMLAVYGPMLARLAPVQLIVFVLMWPAFGALMTHFLGRGLIPLSAAGQSAQADFRSELVYVRDNADSLALTRAGPQLQQTLQGRFEVLKRVIYAQLNVTRVLTFFKMMFGEYGGVIPLLLVAPSYFNGSIDLGTLMELRIIVSRVADSLAFPVGAYEKAIEWAASANRLIFLQMQAEASKHDVRVPVTVGGDHLRAQNVSVLTPEGRYVLQSFELHVAAGERALVLGDAGQGKSLLVRALAGLWSHMHGRVEVPEDCMFIQGFSFPPMSLRRLLVYPTQIDSDVEPALQAVGAACLCKDSESLDVVRHWEDVLSREMQERVQFARVLLQKPRFAVLDEPLASLAPEEADHLLGLLPDSIALVMFSRRPASIQKVIELRDPATQTLDQDAMGSSAPAVAVSAGMLGPSAGALQPSRSGKTRQSAQPSQRACRPSQR